MSLPILCDDKKKEKMSDNNRQHSKKDEYEIHKAISIKITRFSIKSDHFMSNVRLSGNIHSRLKKVGHSSLEDMQISQRFS